ncbi:MAG: hypothetical protein RE471_05980 [Ferroplasma sp.]|uniref:hypothetical protein n=1 Tax=Ferroplasma sp. TaxID=2591003 RepID=UPI002815BA66|nr:hypothetical protein [Ferroplasma sp.]WMT50529.1 MAG: hypothetical protein RE471_05980 [Ferroplasma sp.]
MKILIDQKILDLNNDKLFEVLNSNDIMVIFYNLTDEHKINGKLKNYKIINVDENVRNDFIDKLNLKNKIDKYMLYSIYKKENDFLITENIKILSISQNLGIENQILTISDSYNILSETPSLYSPKIKFDTVDNINLNDKIFDKLKSEYSEFNEWFEKISKEKRKCAVYYNDDDSIGGIIIYKEEKETIKLKDWGLSVKNRLKISTFIVTSTGYKLGELFIRIIIDICLKLKIFETYLTHFPEDNDYLISLIEKYGFIDYGLNERNERVYVKQLIPENYESPNDIIKFDKIYYPSFYDGVKVNKFIIPIKPEFYNRLFVQKNNIQTLITEFSGEPITEKNTIEKAYISNSRIKNINPGDVIMFYRSEDKKSLLNIGIVEKAYRLNNSDDIIKVIGKRSVYNKKDIKNGNQLVIMFLYNFTFKKGLDLDYLIKNEILKGAPQSIMKINNEKYNKIKKHVGIDGCYTFN